MFPLVMKIVLGSAEFNPILAKIDNCHRFDGGRMDSGRLTEQDQYPPPVGGASSVMPPPELWSPDVEQAEMPSPMRAKITAAKTDLVNMIVVPLGEIGHAGPNLE
ncbi:hypothetical protein PH562_28385 [Rhizobium sp. CNPSo 4062]|uniref:hypothetical protein n=1 Tax=Rhizobium sp. CNPSo 4062 TaxID=3021410 RepID=UPI0025518392|nr:hypothetical protein [Rhizobium sp. CNPSo 4062]MDK4706195.1 hypothetical protein [Rhizobium sp. CNPSo 4062]